MSYTHEIAHEKHNASCVKNTMEHNLAVLQLYSPFLYFVMLFMQAFIANT